MEWQPIEKASPHAWNFLLLAYGPEDDQSIGIGCFKNGSWMATGVFYKLGFPRDEAWEFRETKVNPTHWMPLPMLPPVEE